MEPSVDGSLPDDALVGPADWWDPAWSHRRKISIHAAKVGADLVDFPALIALESDEDLAAAARPDGSDLVFVGADGITVLAHELEAYDAATGRLAAWVRMPSLSASADTLFHLYYGNPAGGATMAGSDTWSSDFVGVWHLNSDPALMPAATDSSPHGAHASSTGQMDAASVVPGVAGSALFFDGQDDFLQVPAGSLLQPPTITISVWAHAITIRDAYGSTLVSKAYNEGADEFDHLIRSYGGISCGIRNDADVLASSNDPIFSTGQWHHVVMTYDGTTLTCYMDGNPVAATDSAGVIRISDRPLNIGSFGLVDPERLWHGYIDELRISSAAVSAGWVQTEFLNISEPSAFATVGAVEVLGL